MKIRKWLFYAHLTAGSLAGIVILVMSVTGVLLAYERQLTPWPDRHIQSVPAQTGQAPLPAGTLLAKVCASEQSTPSAVVVHSQPDKPVEIDFGAERALYFNSYTGERIGAVSQGPRAFFRTVEGVHRWLGAPIAHRPAARMVTGIANLAFLVLVSSGIFLWWPKSWTWSGFKAAVTWRWDHRSGRAREWNWHTVTGFWCALPLLVIVSCGVVMSFPWANNLLYRVTGNAPPAAQQGPGAGAPERAAAGASRIERGRPAQACGGWDFDQVNQVWARAERQVPGWQTINLRGPAHGASAAVFAIDQGNGGRPDLRSQLTLDWRTGDLIRWEPFSSYNAGRRLRAWVRFSHTGEAGGILGQTVAALATAGVVVLAPTGLFMAWRRFLWQWRPAAGGRGEIAVSRDEPAPARKEQAPLNPSSFP